MPDVARFLGKLARTATLRPFWQRYGVAIALALCAGVLTPALTDVSRAPFFTLFTFAVVLSSLFGGMKPGLWACATSAAEIAYLAPPAASFRVSSPDDIVPNKNAPHLVQSVALTSKTFVSFQQPEQATPSSENSTSPPHTRHS